MIIKLNQKQKESLEQNKVMAYEEPHGWNETIVTELCQSLRVTHLQKIIILKDEDEKKTI